MRRSVVVVDDFYDDPDGVRRYALAQPIYYPYQSGADVERGRVRASWATTRYREADDCPFKSSAELIGKLEAAVGEPIDLADWRAGFPLNDEGQAAPDCDEHTHGSLWNCSFHFKPDVGQDLGEGVHNHVTDRWNTVGPDGWAGLIYLTPDAPPRGGLKLWRNRDPRRRYDWLTPKAEWELIDDLGNVYNRLLLVRGDWPHSGANGWGTSWETGRMYQTFFFRVTSPGTGPGVNIALQDHAAAG